MITRKIRVEYNQYGTLRFINEEKTGNPVVLCVGVGNLGPFIFQAMSYFFPLIPADKYSVSLDMWILTDDNYDDRLFVKFQNSGDWRYAEEIKSFDKRSISLIKHIFSPDFDGRHDGDEEIITVIGENDKTGVKEKHSERAFVQDHPYFRLE